MALVVRRNLGMLLLGIYLVLAGLSGLVAMPMLPGVMAVLALVAGIFILLGR